MTKSVVAHIRAPERWPPVTRPNLGGPRRRKVPVASMFVHIRALGPFRLNFGRPSPLGLRGPRFPLPPPLEVPMSVGPRRTHCLPTGPRRVEQGRVWGQEGDQRRVVQRGPPFRRHLIRQLTSPSVGDLIEHPGPGPFRRAAEGQWDLDSRIPHIKQCVFAHFPPKSEQ